jgi:membrane-associated phospholipid phosphatase
MLPFERLVIGYLGFFVIAAPFTHVERRRQVRTMLAAASFAGAVLLAARALPLEARLALPLAYIALGYWLPVGLVSSRRHGALEAWLTRTDAALRRRLPITVPRGLSHAMELGYLACFPLVPAAFAVVSIAGSQADVARFWMSLLAAGYACYGTLPWLVSRPPRLLDDAATATSTPMARVNVRVLNRISHGLNTFPSGHVAVSVAAAIAVGDVWPSAGVVTGIVAAAVALGAVAGRYHYIADVVVGAGIGIAVTLG